MTKLSNLELILKLKSDVKNEKQATQKVLEDLLEIDKRKLHLERGYPHLHQFVVKECGYSEAEAALRISAMYLLKSVPEIKPVLNKISLSNVATLQNFFRVEKKYTKEEKIKLVTQMQNKSTRECIQELRTLSPLAIPKESVKQITAEEKSIRFVIGNELDAKLKKIKELASHKLKSGTFEELVQLMADLTLQQLEKPSQQRRSFVAKKSSGVIKTPTSSRYIPVNLKREIFHRDQGMCQYVDPLTNKKCTSRIKLELDHRIPLAIGGTTTLQNLQLLCSSHNKFMAVKKLGGATMRGFLKRG